MNTPTKRCSACKREKPISAFHKCNRKKDGLYPSCKECKNKWYLANREKVIARVVLHQKQNKDWVNAKNRAWRKANPEINSLYYRLSLARHPGRKQELSRAWRKSNAHIVNAGTAARRAQKKQATPAWANPFFMREAYHLARLRTKATGIKWVVDHIVPLQSDEVCGLHCEANLRVIPESVNKIKGNQIVQEVTWPF